MRLFVYATFPMVALLLAAALAGGGFVLAALFYITLLVMVLDRLEGPAEVEEQEGRDGANKISVSLACAHFVVLFYTLWALGGAHLGLVEKIGLFMAAGLFMGQVSNANAHELIHRPARGLHRLGMWVYISMLFGHHTSAHVLVHHTHVATREDPNTARKGEGFYRYAMRAWLGSFRRGYAAEAARLTLIGRPAWRNPYVVYVGGALLFLGLVALLGGPKLLALYVALAGYAQSQLLLSDYVQHYGLQRDLNADGRPQSVGTQHSWNSPHWFSSALMLNATRHSDHHAHPARSYPDLTLPPDAPLLPRPLPVMASIALVPVLWRRIMDPKVEKLSRA